MINRLVLWANQLLFTLVLGPLFLWPNLAYSRPVRSLIAFVFGRLVAPHYHRVIAVYGETYGVALERGLYEASKLMPGVPTRVIDCGVGTGFVSRTVRGHFPDATIVGVDLAPAMLRNTAGSRTEVALVRGDTSSMPLADGVADLVVAQNTTPFLAEFARVCAPGGVVIFTDSSVRAVAGAAGRAAERTGMFDLVRSHALEAGFYLVGRRRSVPSPKADASRSRAERP